MCVNLIQERFFQTNLSDLVHLEPKMFERIISALEGEQEWTINDTQLADLLIDYLQAHKEVPISLIEELCGIIDFTLLPASKLMRFESCDNFPPKLLNRITLNRIKFTELGDVSSIKRSWSVAITNPKTLTLSWDKLVENRLVKVTASSCEEGTTRNILKTFGFFSTENNPGCWICFQFPLWVKVSSYEFTHGHVREKWFNLKNWELQGCRTELGDRWETIFRHLNDTLEWEGTRQYHVGSTEGYKMIRLVGVGKQRDESYRMAIRNCRFQLNVDLNGGL
jgi:hypothetical protein